MTRRTRTLVIVGALLAIQAGAVAVYFAIERDRAAPAPFHAEPLGGEPAPALALEHADGTLVTLPPARLRLVHFWATWCPPCAKELPGLLALGHRLQPMGLDLVAVAIEDDWTQVRAFFGGALPAEVVRARDRVGYKRYGVTGLPDTYLVDASGRLMERFAGARDWTSAAAARHLGARLQAAPARPSSVTVGAP